jgi:GT2 family glycosyltransferase
VTPISYVTCTRNRAAELADTIRRLDALHRGRPEPVEFVIADNGSDVPVRDTLPESDIPVRVVRLPENIGAAARNYAADEAEHDWLDDDSAPKDLGHLDVLSRVSEDTAVVMADITLPDGSRERGGLPEVLVGCGAAIRKPAYLEAGGYDPSFFFAAEEPDLCARIIANGWRVEPSPWFRVLHHKTSTNRDLNRMLRLLTRNQGVIVERTTPDYDRSFLRRDHVRRCAWIASKENAVEGFRQGLAELRTIRHTLRREPLIDCHYERFVGLHHAREAIQRVRVGTACVIHEGKHAWAVRRALDEAGIRLVSANEADRLVIGTLSPGPMLDALAGLRAAGQGERALAPWIEAPRLLDCATRPAQAIAPARSQIRA